MKHTTVLQAEAVGFRALKDLGSSDKRAEVLGVFDRGLYIDVGKNRRISIIADGNYIGPSSIVIGQLESEGFKSLGIEAGMEIVFDENKLVFGNGLFAVNLDKSSVWSLPPLPKRKDLIAISKVSLNLRILRDVIYTCPSREGLVPLLESVELYGPTQIFLRPQKPNLSERARPNIETLMWGLFGGDFNMIASMASSILGLGPGLTPSCDDFLAGLILSLNSGGRLLLKDKRNELEFFKKVSSEICRLSGQKTTVYSQDFLNGARRGEGPKAVIELVYSLLTGHPNDVAASSKKVIRMGETSGGDIAVGVYYGIRFLISRLERLEDLEDFESILGAGLAPSPE